jgi:hypothetical protein
MAGLKSTRSRSPREQHNHADGFLICLTDGLQAGRPGFGSRVGRRIIFFSPTSRPALGPTQPIKWIKGTLPQGVKLQGRNADHSFRSSAEVENTCAVPPLPHMFSWRKV